MASIAGIYGGFGAGPADDGAGGRGNLFSKFKKDIIKEQASQAQAKRDHREQQQLQQQQQQQQEGGNQTYTNLL